MRERYFLQDFSEQLYVIICCLAIACVFAFSYSKGWRPFEDLSDSASYISMAKGDAEGVRLHHAKRVLHPSVVRLVSNVTEIHSAFLFVATTLLFATLLTGCKLIRNYAGLKTYVALPLLITPFLVESFQLIYYGGLMFLFLSMVYFKLLFEKKYLLCVLVLFTMALTRDEALILAFTTLLAICYQMYKGENSKTEYIFAVGVLCALFCASIILNVMTTGNANMHNMPALIFSLGRMPLFLMNNFTGFHHWVDTYAQLPYYSNEPIYKIAAPTWLKAVSSITEIGIYRWSLEEVVRNWLLIFCSFGSLGSVLLFSFFKLKRPLFESSLAQKVALLFGMFSFLMAPVLGPPALRYYVTAWPLFLLIVTLTLGLLQQSDSEALLPVIILSFVCSWLWYLSVEVGINNGLLLAIAVILHWLTWSVLSSAFRQHDG